MTDRFNELFGSGRGGSARGAEEGERAVFFHVSIQDVRFGDDAKTVSRRVLVERWLGPHPLSEAAARHVEAHELLPELLEELRALQAAGKAERFAPEDAPGPVVDMHYFRCHRGEWVADEDA